MSPFEARDVIANGENTEFDPKVVAAFNSLFRRGVGDLVRAAFGGVGRVLLLDPPGLHPSTSLGVP